MPEPTTWLSKALAEDILHDIAKVRAFTAGLVHSMTADESRPERSALVEVVGQLDDLAVSVRDRLGVPAVLRERSRELPAVPHREVGLNTAGRRLQGNVAKHRARP